jgi:pseudouridine synthase
MVPMAAVRLQKLLAAAGLGSRRHAEDLLRSGRVRVNGVVAHLGDRADPHLDRVAVDGRPLPAAVSSLTLLLNKPVGVLSTCSDPHGRGTVLDLLPPSLSHGRGLHPVGRLDADSRGALLLSNDGALTLRLTHPRFGHLKTYRVRVAGEPSPEALRRWRAGVPLDGRPARPVRLRVLGRQGGDTLLELGMREGRRRQIRRTGEILGHDVLDLERIAIGSLRLGDLPVGAWRRLRAGEIAALVHPGDPAPRSKRKWEDPGSPP